MGLLSTLTGDGLLQAGSGLIGGLFGAIGQRKANEANMKINQMNNEFNERMLDKQLAYQTDMWNKTNEYNTASNQRKRLEDAGLNPYIMMSGGNAGTATAMSGGSTSAASPIPMQSVASGALQGMSQAGQLAIATGSTLADIANKNADTAGKQMANDWYVQKTLAELGYLSAATRDKDAAAAINRQRYQLNMESWDSQVEAFRIQNAVNRAMINRITSETTLIELQSISQRWQNLALPMQLKQSILQGWANLDLTDAKTREAATAALVNQAKAYNIQLDNKAAEELYDDYVAAKKSEYRVTKSYNDQYSGTDRAFNQQKLDEANVSKARNERDKIYTDMEVQKEVLKRYRTNTPVSVDFGPFGGFTLR